MPTRVAQARALRRVARIVQDARALDSPSRTLVLAHLQAALTKVEIELDRRLRLAADADRFESAPETLPDVDDAALLANYSRLPL